MPVRESKNESSREVTSETFAGNETPSTTERYGLFGLLIYAWATLGSQATMSIGIAFAVLGQWIQLGGPMDYFRALRSACGHRAVRGYLFVTNLLTLACFISLVGARFFPVRYGSRIPDVKFFHDLWKAWYFYWPVLLLPGFMALSRGGARKFLNGYLGAAALVGALGWVQFFTGFPTDRPIPGFDGFHHVQGFFGHHLSFASIMIFPFFLLLEESVKRLRARDRYGWLAALAAFVFFVALWGTFSRMLWIALPIGVAFFFAVQLRGSRRGWMLAGFALLLIGLTQVPMLRDRITNSMGTEERITLWKINGEFFTRRPITGVGWHHNLPLSAGYFEEKFPADYAGKFVGHAHNNFLEVAASLGILGLLAFLAWNVYVIRLSFLYSAGLLAAWIVFQLNGLTQVNFWEAKVLHTMALSTAILLVRAIRRGPAANPFRPARPPESIV